MRIVAACLLLLAHGYGHCAPQVGSIPSGAAQAGSIADNIVTSAKIVNETIDTADIKNGAITAAKIMTAAVDTAAIANGAINTGKIIVGAVDTNRLGPDSVTGVKIIAGSIDSNKLTSGILVPGGFKSPFSVEGATFTVVNGVVNMPSNPYFISAGASLINPMVHTVQYNVYWGESVDVGNMFNASASSSIVTIPAGAGGLYRSCYTISYDGSATATTKQSYTYVNGGDAGLYDQAPLSTQQHSQSRCTLHVLAAGDTLQIRVYSVNAASDMVMQGGNARWIVTKER